MKDRPPALPPEIEEAAAIFELDLDDIEEVAVPDAAVEAAAADAPATIHAAVAALIEAVAPARDDHDLEVEGEARRGAANDPRSTAT